MTSAAIFVRLSSLASIAPAAWLALAISLAGCDGVDPMGRQGFTGQVTLDGEPIKQGSIRFESEAGTGESLATGAPITDGKYELPPNGGLTEGKYKVYITSVEPDTRSADEIMNNPGPPAKELVPAKYNVNSELVTTIPTDLVDGKLDYSLTSK